ncbi:MAG: tRNA-dihydrouridine synthase [Flavonifractor plautii]
MKIAFAPMEGLTGALYRQAHCRWFGGVDRYFIPFITPTQDHRFTKRELREILPEHNGGLTAVPQLLVRRAEDFLWAAGELAAMGYPEINLNLGCPSGTVVAKGKGSGFLGLPEELERFLDTVFDAAPCAVSIKTRLGLREPEEFGPLLALFQRYPLAELIVHPRVQKDMYKNTPRRAYFARALADSPFPVCYNGDLYTVPALEAFQAEFPAAERIMLGRGLAGDPALARKAGGGPAAAEELRCLPRPGVRGLRRGLRQPPQRHAADEGGLVLPHPPVRGQPAARQGHPEGTGHRRVRERRGGGLPGSESVARAAAGR